MNIKSASRAYAGVSSDFITAKHRGSGVHTSIFPAPIRALVNFAHSGKIEIATPIRTPASITDIHGKLSLGSLDC